MFHQNPNFLPLMGLGLMANSGPSFQPVGLGQALGRAGIGAVEMSSQLAQQGLQRKIADMQLKRMEDELKERKRKRKLMEGLQEEIAAQLQGTDVTGIGGQQGAMLQEQAGEFATPQGIGQALLQTGAGLGDPRLMAAGLNYTGMQPPRPEGQFGTYGGLGYYIGPNGNIQWQPRPRAGDQLSALLAGMQGQPQEQPPAEQPKEDARPLPDVLGGLPEKIDPENLDALENRGTPVDVPGSLEGVARFIYSPIAQTIGSFATPPAELGYYEARKQLGELIERYNNPQGAKDRLNRGLYLELIKNLNRYVKENKPRPIPTR